MNLPHRLSRRPLFLLIALSFTLIAIPLYSLKSQDSLRLKLGQMIVVGFLGSTVPDSLFVDLSQRNLGGVVISVANGNLNDPAQIGQLTDALRAAATVAPFIAVDQEGGRVARLGAGNGFAATNSAYTLGTTYGSLDSTRAQAALMAGWLVQCGMNLNLAPVLDVNVNPLSPAIGYYGRSFSADPADVTSHAAVFIDEFHERGLITAAKHFPGHGSATSDSHFSLPDITSTWSDAELNPYRALMTAGRIDMVMVGHLFNAQIDSVYPTSLSALTIDGLLRGSLGYNGVVITDAMGMGALANFDFFDRAELAVNAGADILLYTSNIRNNNSLVRELVDSLAARVANGHIAEKRIEDAYNRIMALKNRSMITGVGRLIASAPVVPDNYELSNYPNPFNPRTIIRVALPHRSVVRLEIFDVLGRKVATLLEGEAPAGVTEVAWVANAGSGVYFCRLDAAPVNNSIGGVNVVRKLLRVQ